MIVLGHLTFLINLNLIYMKNIFYYHMERTGSSWIRFVFFMCAAGLKFEDWFEEIVILKI